MTRIHGLKIENFNDEGDHLTTTAHVTVSIPVGLAFDKLPTREELIRAALANFAEHPVLSDKDEIASMDDETAELYVESIVLEK